MASLRQTLPMETLLKAFSTLIKLLLGKNAIHTGTRPCTDVTILAKTPWSAQQQNDFLTLVMQKEPRQVKPELGE